MIVTEARITLCGRAAGAKDRLRGFGSITFDDMFVVKDLRVIEGDVGLFVAMPSRRRTDRCPECGSSNHLEQGYCGRCGFELDARRAHCEPGPPSLRADVAHPINAACRDMIQDAVLAAYYRELAARRPGRADGPIRPETP